MSTLEEHRLLVADELCQGRYRQAIFRTVKAGDLVLDLGTGTGIHALFACQAGAKRVYAVEQGEIIDLAKGISRANGFQDRIVFIQGLSSQVQLPEKVDVIVTNLGFRGTLSFLIDLREKFLQEDGTVIPAAVELFCVPLEWPSAYAEMVEFWGRDHYGMNFSPLHQVAINEGHGRNFTADRFLAEPSSMGRLDLRTATATQIGGEASFHASRAGTLHGLGVWYTLWLAADLAVSTAPPLAHPSPPWGQSFFPIERPVAVQGGDRIVVRLKAYAFTTAEMVWTWEVRVEGGGLKAAFTHSTFQGVPLSRESLHRQDPNYTPPLTPLGRAACLALDRCDGKTPLGEIEREVFRLHSALFRTQQDAAAFVAKVFREFGI
jgi:type I protein arginine methyltransferase